MPYAMRTKFLPPYVGRGFSDSSGDVFSQLWNSLSDASASGASSTGSVADTLIKAGYSIATISALLNQVSAVAGATPQMLQQAQLEQQWLAQYQTRTNWVPILVIGGLLLWAVSKSRK